MDRKRRSYGEKRSGKKPRSCPVPCPKRFMFLENGSWSEFSPEVSTCLREAYLSGKHLIEIVLNCCLYMVNFVQMVQVDVQSGCKRSISWVDDLDHVKSPATPFEDEGFDSKKEGKSAREASSSSSVLTDISEVSTDITSEPTGESFVGISTDLSLGIAAKPLKKQVKITGLEQQVNLQNEPVNAINNDSGLATGVEEQVNTGLASEPFEKQAGLGTKQVNITGITSEPFEKQAELGTKQVNVPCLANEPLDKQVNKFNDVLSVGNSSGLGATSLDMSRNVISIVGEQVNTCARLAPDVTRKKRVNSSGLAATRLVNTSGLAARALEKQVNSSGLEKEVNTSGLAGKPLEKLVSTAARQQMNMTKSGTPIVEPLVTSTITNLTSGFSRNYVLTGSLKNQFNENMNSVSENMTTKTNVTVLLRKLDVNDDRFAAVKKAFLAGLEYGLGTEVTGVYEVGYGGPVGLARKEAFERRIEFTRNARGDPNVKFAWYGCSNKELLGIIQHGFRPNVDSTYGVGVYLIPENLSRLSLGTDVDDKGEQHVLLCRVILGKSELVEAGSGMFHPSSDQFDTGVDNLVDPTKYIIWSTHMNTHILPLYITSFKKSRQSQDVMQEASSMKGKCVTVASKEKMKPKPALLSVLKDVISASDMSLVLQEYGEFENGKLTKEAYVERIKSIVGAEKLKRSIVGAEKLKKTIIGDEKLKKIYENLQKQTQDMHAKTIHEQVLRSSSSLLCGLLLYQNQAQAAQAKLMQVANRDIRSQ